MAPPAASSNATATAVRLTRLARFGLGIGERTPPGSSAGHATIWRRASPAETEAVLVRSLLQRMRLLDAPARGRRAVAAGLPRLRPRRLSQPAPRRRLLRPPGRPPAPRPTPLQPGAGRLVLPGRLRRMGRDGRGRRRTGGRRGDRAAGPPGGRALR